MNLRYSTGALGAAAARATHKSLAAGSNASRFRGGGREDNLNFVKTHFLPDLLRDLADIISGRRRDWLPPDDIFIRTLESHLDGPSNWQAPTSSNMPTRASLLTCASSAG